jgi:hypothetical protein
VAGTTPARGQGRAFSIDRFAVSITVHPDASLDVREAITFDFRGSHQAVYRVIPVRYPRGGFEFALRLDGVQVLDEQLRPLKTNVSYSGRYVRVKAWVPGAVNTTKTVTVVYRVRRGLFNVDDHEELYWNVTGDEWDVPIRQAEAVVVGPPAAIPGDALAIAYTGSRGIAGTDYVEQRDGNVLTFRTTRPLRPREGLTIAVSWPPGWWGDRQACAPPSGSSRTTGRSACPCWPSSWDCSRGGPTGATPPPTARSTPSTRLRTTWLRRRPACW